MAPRDPAVKQLQSALVKARVMTQAQMNSGPGSFGPRTQASLKKFQQAHGVDAIGVYGPKTRAAFVRLGAKVAAVPQASRSDRSAQENRRGGKVGRRQQGPDPLPAEAPDRRHQASAQAAAQYRLLGFRDALLQVGGRSRSERNGYNGAGYTGTLEAHMRHIPQIQLQPGDLCLWKGKHVSLVVQAGADPLLISHGEEKGPYAIRFSAQKRGFRGTPLIWLTLPRGRERHGARG